MFIVIAAFCLISDSKIKTNVLSILLTLHTWDTRRHAVTKLKYSMFIVHA